MFPVNFIPSLLAVFLALSHSTCHAEEEAGNEESFFQEFPTVLTSSRLAQPLAEAPSAMTVIDREMIKASGFRSLPELMRLVPGMYVGSPMRIVRSFRCMARRTSGRAGCRYWSMVAASICRHKAA